MTYASRKTLSAHEAKRAARVNDGRMSRSHKRRGDSRRKPLDELRRRGHGMVPTTFKTEE